MLIFQIKFLLNKPGAAMVEMDDHVACNTVIQCLGKQTLFGKQLEFRYSVTVGVISRLVVLTPKQGMVSLWYIEP